MELLSQALANSAKANSSSGAKVNDVTYNAPRATNALSSVINYIVTDAFNLDPEESLWVGYRLEEVLSPLRHISPKVILAAVDKELSCGEYSNRMIQRVSRSSTMHAYADTSFSAGVRYAPVSDWVEGISDIVLNSYPNLKPMLRSSIVGSINGLFMELGVSDDPRKSRSSLYLPTSVRYLVSINEG